MKVSKFRIVVQLWEDPPDSDSIQRQEHLFEVSSLSDWSYLSQVMANFAQAIAQEIANRFILGRKE